MSELYIGGERKLMISEDEGSFKLTFDGFKTLELSPSQAGLLAGWMTGKIYRRNDE